MKSYRQVIYNYAIEQNYISKNEVMYVKNTPYLINNKYDNSLKRRDGRDNKHSIDNLF